MAQTPSVRSNLDVGGMNFTGTVVFNVFGRTGESWQTMEGVSTVSSKDTQSGQFIDFSAVEEANVQTFAGEADNPSSGIATSIVIKSGGNAFHGGAYAAATGKRFQSNNINDALRAARVPAGDSVEYRRDFSGDFRGRILPNKLWFYGAVRQREGSRNILGSVQPDGSPGYIKDVQRFATIKLSYQLTPGNRIIVFSQGQWADRMTGVNQFIPWSSRVRLVLFNGTRKAEWQGIRGNVVSSVQYGRWGLDGEFLPFEPAGVGTFDQVTQARTGTQPNVGTVPTEHRDHVLAQINWYKSNVLGGNHEIKAGMDWMPYELSRPWKSRADGNYTLIFNNGSPFQIQTYNYPVVPLSKSNYVSFFAKDNWTIGRRLTINAGGRWAYDAGWIPGGCRPDAEPREFAPSSCWPEIQANTWQTFSPRLYFSYDATGDGRTAIKGGWGRFVHMRQVEELNSVNPNVATTTTWRWADSNRSNRYDVGEVNLNPNGPDFISVVNHDNGAATVTNGVINPDEKLPGTHQFTVSLERQVMANFSVRVTGLYTRDFDTYRLANVLRPYESYSIPIVNPDPGPDNVVGTVDDPGRTVTYFDYPQALAGLQFQRPTYTNPPGHDLTYKTVETSAIKRLSDRWQLMASVSATKVNEPFVPESNFDPNAEINQAKNYWEWMAKGSGAYLLPFDVTASASVEHRSGAPQARQVLFRGGRQIPSITLNVEPLGSIRLPHVNILDLRLEKAFNVTAGQRITARVNVYNALNANTVLSRTLLSGVNYLRPSSILAPRIVEFSGVYAF